MEYGHPSMEKIPEFYVHSKILFSIVENMTQYKSSIHRAVNTLLVWISMMFIVFSHSTGFCPNTYNHLYLQKNAGKNLIYIYIYI